MKPGSISNWAVWPLGIQARDEIDFLLGIRHIPCRIAQLGETLPCALLCVGQELSLPVVGLSSCCCSQAGGRLPVGDLDTNKT